MAACTSGEPCVTGSEFRLTSILGTDILSAADSKQQKFTGQRLCLNPRFWQQTLFFVAVATGAYLRENHKVILFFAM
jgi:hypothetical protein